MSIYESNEKRGKMSYRKVIAYIEEEIKNTHLKSGSKLPLVAIVAEELKCSTEAVKKAYEILVKEKIAYDIEGRSFYLLKNPEMNLPSDKIYLNQLNYRPSLVNEYDSFGLPFQGVHQDFFGQDQGLLKVLKNYFKKRSIHLECKQLIITSHLKEAFEVLLETLLDQKQQILIENPTHPELIKTLQNHEKLNIYHKLDHMDFNLLELLFIQKNIKIFVLQGDESLPYGQTLSLKEKLKLLDLCQQYDVYLIDLDFSSDGNAYIEHQTLYALDTYERVFYVKTFHQYFHESLKIISMIVPNSYRDTLLHLKANKYGQPSQVEQNILRQVIEKKMNNHEETYNKDIEHRHDAVMALFENYKEALKNIVKINEHNNHIFICLPSKYDLESMKLAMTKMNIEMTQASDFYFTETFKQGFVLSLSYHNESFLKKAFTIIFDYLLEHKEATWL